MSKGTVLFGDLTPQIKGAAGTDLFDILTGFVLSANGRVFHVTSVCDKQIIIFSQIQKILMTIREKLHTFCNLLSVMNIKTNIHDLRIEMELYALSFQILNHGKDHGFILVILGKAQCTQIRQSVNVVNETLHVPLHFKGTVAVVEGKHGTPVGPEIAAQHFIIQNIRDSLLLQHFIRSENQAGELHCRFITQAKLTVCMCILPLFFCNPAKRIIGVFLVQPVILVENTDSFCLNRWNGTE